MANRIDLENDDGPIDGRGIVLVRVQWLENRPLPESRVEFQLDVLGAIRPFLAFKFPSKPAN